MPFFNYMKWVASELEDDNISNFLVYYYVECENRQPIFWKPTQPKVKSKFPFKYSEDFESM